MATTTVMITLTTPANVTIPQVVDTLSTYWGYSATLPGGGPNPETKGQFVQRMVARYVKESYKTAKAETDGNTARLAALATADLVTVE